LKVKVIDIPVAKGSIIKFFIKLIPKECKKFINNDLVNCKRKDDPTALG
jgi:hypothetical protein